MRLGVRAHDFGKLPVEELAARIGGKGFSCIQLALAKALAGIDTSVDILSPGLAFHIKDAFYRQNIQIAVLGCYVNLIHPGREERKRLLGSFKEHIRFARDFGCSIVASETGSMNADYSYTPENHTEKAFSLLTESVKELVEEAEKFGVLVGIEGVAKHVVSTPQKMKRLIDIIGSNNLQVVFDPVNFLTEDNYRDQEDILRESFDLFGDRMVILHDKDFIIDGGKIRAVAAGKGLLNHELLFQLLKPRKPYINVLLEDTKPDTVDESARFVRDVYDRV